MNSMRTNTNELNYAIIRNNTPIIITLDDIVAILIFNLMKN